MKILQGKKYTVFLCAILCNYSNQIKENEKKYENIIDSFYKEEELWMVRKNYILKQQN